MQPRDNPVLHAAPRTEFGRQTKRLRRDGLVPASVYRRGEDSLHISVPAAEFERVHRRSGSSGIVDLLVENARPLPVLCHNIERHPINGHLLHVVLLQVRMGEPITVDVPVRFQGEAPAVRELGATVVTARDHIRVEAMPGDLPPHADADLSALCTTNDEIRVRDLKLPPGATAITDADEVVATVVPPTKPAVEPETGLIEEEPAAAAGEQEKS